VRRARAAALVLAVVALGTLNAMAWRGRTVTTTTTTTTETAGPIAEQYVRESIVAPNAFKAPGANNGVGDMPTLPVDAIELTALVAYLLTL
jgi:hypothetical protein